MKKYMDPGWQDRTIGEMICAVLVSGPKTADEIRETLRGWVHPANVDSALQEMERCGKIRAI